MIDFIVGENLPIVAALGLLVAFVGTCFLTSKLCEKLPRDGGREFAVDGKLSAGKPRGAGIIFVLVFVFASLIFAPFSIENLIYLVLVAIEMMTGFMDDASEHPWGELKKGLMDLAVAVILSFTYLHYNGSTIKIATLDIDIKLPTAVFVILAVILIWMAINVTNCADGVDGLSGTLTIITLATFYVIGGVLDNHSEFQFLILIFVICILGYLWYNATPSRLLMGDAGSRAMGIFISIAALKSGSPLLFIPVAFMLIVDGGIGLLKVSLIRAFKIYILKNTKTPLHDHVRHTLKWSNTQTVFRFAIIQIVISIAIVYCLVL